MTGDKFIYPKIIKEVQKMCQHHIDGVSSADTFQRVIQRAEIQIIAFEESDIRNKMIDVEGRLEMIKFTLELEQQDLATIEVAKELLDWLNSRGGTPNHKTHIPPHVSL